MTPVIDDNNLEALVTLSAQRAQARTKMVGTVPAGNNDADEWVCRQRRHTPNTEWQVTNYTFLHTR